MPGMVMRKVPTRNTLPPMRHVQPADDSTELHTPGAEAETRNPASRRPMSQPPCALTRRAGLSLLALQALPREARARPSNTVRIATGDYPPYTDARQPDGGLVTARLRAALAVQGLEARFEFLPWARAKEETRAGHFDASSYWWADDNLRRDFLLSRPLVSNALRWLRLRSRPLRLGDAVAVMLGYNYPKPVQHSMRQLKLKPQVVHSHLTGVRMVLHERVAAIPVDEGNACALLASFTAAERSSLVLSPAQQPMDLRPGLVIFPKALPGSAALQRQLDAGLQATLTETTLLNTPLCTELEPV